MAGNAAIIMNLPHNYKLIELESVDSTNLEAIRLIKGDSIGDGSLVILAESQTGGMGRLGRRWISEAGNLFVSVVCRCPVKQREDLNLEPDASLLPFLTALAIGETLKAFIKDSDITYKWPNDVLVNGKKISGVLIEIISGYIVIGVGVNIASYPKENTKLAATCIDEHSTAATMVAEVLEVFIDKLDKRLQASRGGIVDEWMAHAYGINKNVAIKQEKKEISGIYRGVDQNGQLILEIDGGRRELVFYGDVRFSG
jgi:BirA family biotin operon repressor/biotin-[acetyl-CoA-carboxylase] ligase